MKRKKTGDARTDIARSPGGACHPRATTPTTHGSAQPRRALREGQRAVLGFWLGTR